MTAATSEIPRATSRCRNRPASKPHPADHLFPRYSSRPLGRPRRIESELEELLPGHPPMIGGRVAEEQEPLDRPGETRHSKHDERLTPPAGDNDPNDDRRRDGAAKP